MGEVRFHILGGAGSGNFGHAGRPGSVGGSVGGRGRGEFSDAKGIKLSDFDSWKGTRGEFAREAFYKVNQPSGQVLILKDNGEVKGIASFWQLRKNLYITILATKEKGYGTKMMQRISKEASQKQLGIKLISSQESEGFYEKIGMTRGLRGAFTFTKQQAADFAKTGPTVHSTSTLLDELMILEPDDGVFVIPESTPTINFHTIALHGGGGSGNFGHKGRPGSVGGSVGGKGAEIVRGKELSLKDLEKAAENTSRMIGDKAPLYIIDGQDYALKAILQEQGFDGKPTVVDKETLDKMVESGQVTEMFRGVYSSEQVEQFRTGELYVGIGGMGNGTYAAFGKEGRDEAMGYAKNEDTLIRFGLRSDARTIVLKNLRKDMLDNESKFRQKKELIDKVSKTVESQFFDPGKVAASLGYDAILDKEGGIAVILNRTALVVQK